MSRARAEPTLASLQGQIKRDPAAWRSEFELQHQRYEAELAIVRIKASAPEQRFAELVKFMSHVAPCYPEQCAQFPAQVSSLLQERVSELEPQLRLVLVQALILVRNRGLMEPLELFKLLFGLFRRVHAFSPFGVARRKRARVRRDTTRFQMRG